MTTSTQESLWVLRAQCGDHEALECLLRSVQPSLRRFVRGIVGTSHADDVLQDVLIVVCRKLKSLHAPELFRPWAFRIAGRQAFRHIRREKRWPEQPSDESVLDESSAENTSSSTELFDEVLSLENLSPASRERPGSHPSHCHPRIDPTSESRESGPPNNPAKGYIDAWLGWRNRFLQYSLAHSSA